MTLERFRKAVFRRLIWLYHKVGNGRITDVNRLVPSDALAAKKLPVFNVTLRVPLLLVICIVPPDSE